MLVRSERMEANMMNMMSKRLLILEDGSVYEGHGFGSHHYQVGELVFNTGMSGYQEVLSDLSYCGQIVMMTYPMIGNYGVNRDDFESLDPAVFGFVVKEYCEQPSNFRCDLTLDEFLKLKGIPAQSQKSCAAAVRCVPSWRMRERMYRQW